MRTQDRGEGRVVRITDISVTMVSWENIPAARYGNANPATVGRSDIGVVAIETDAGITGHAFLGASFRPAHLDAVMLTEVLKPTLMGRDPLDREVIWQGMNRMRRGATYRVIGALDVALWDLAGKAANLPLHKLIGSFRRRVPAYASSSTLANEAAYLEQLASVKARGFTAYKIHPPRDLDATIALCQAVRRAAGPEMTLMIDAMMMLRLPEAMRLGRVIEELGFAWYEDPLGEDDIHNYVALREKLDIPILATEYASGGFEAFTQWLARGATDYIRGDIAVKGGLTPLLKAAHLAEAFGTTLEVHHGGNSWNNVAQLHLLMALPNARYFEVLLPDGAQKFGLVRDIEVEPDGTVAIDAFERPGVGAEIDWDLVRANTIGVLR
jgi:L-alanine-DL-glutamate epimerase-like enolase superfamily enzyme